MSLGIFTKATDPTEFLKDELLITLRATQDKNTIESIKTPAEFVEKRSAQINLLFRDKIKPYYDERLEEYKDLHLPEEMVKTMAKKSVMRFYDEQMELLELTQPGAYQKAFGVVAVNHNASIVQDKIAVDDSYEKYYKQRKNAKKAKKSEKKARKAGL